MKDNLVLLVVLLISFCVSFGGGVAAGASSDGLRFNYPLGVGKESGNIHGALPERDRFGVEDGALLFDGSNDWLEFEELGCFLNFDRDWSLNVWVYSDGMKNHLAFFAGADGGLGAKQFVVAGNYVKFSSKADTDSDWRVNFPEPTPAAWHMYTVTWSRAGQLKVFVDGVLQGEDSDGELKDFCPENTPVLGAVNFISKTQHFKGRIDDFMIYDRVLTEAEIGQFFR